MKLCYLKSVELFSFRIFLTVLFLYGCRSRRCPVGNVVFGKRVFEQRWFSDQNLCTSDKRQTSFELVRKEQVERWNLRPTKFFHSEIQVFRWRKQQKKRYFSEMW